MTKLINKCMKKLFFKGMYKNLLIPTKEIYIYVIVFVLFFCIVCLYCTICTTFLELLTTFYHDF